MSLLRSACSPGRFLALLTLGYRAGGGSRSLSVSFNDRRSRRHEPGSILRRASVRLRTPARSGASGGRPAEMHVPLRCPRRRCGPRSPTFPGRRTRQASPLGNGAHGLSDCGRGHARALGHRVDAQPCPHDRGAFLVKDLLVHWRTGESWFWDTLVDADLANHVASWQWVAGCGADAASHCDVRERTRDVCVRWRCGPRAAACSVE